MRVIRSGTRGCTRWQGEARGLNTSGGTGTALPDAYAAVGGCAAPAGSSWQASRRCTARLGHAYEFNRIELAGVDERTL